MVDESLLTGESVPVRKAIGKLEEQTWRPGGDDQPYIYSGNSYNTRPNHRHSQSHWRQNGNGQNRRSTSTS